MSIFSFDVFSKIIGICISKKLNPYFPELFMVAWSNLMKTETKLKCNYAWTNFTCELKEPTQENSFTQRSHFQVLLES